MEQKILENILMEKMRVLFCGITLLPRFSTENCDKKKLVIKVFC